MQSYPTKTFFQALLRRVKQGGRRLQRGVRRVFDDTQAVRVQPPKKQAAPMPPAMQVTDFEALADGLHLVLAPTKTGSETLEQILHRLPIKGLVYRTHWLAQTRLLSHAYWQRPVESGLPCHKVAQIVASHGLAWPLLQMKEQLMSLESAHQANHPERPHVIVSVREPVARYLSWLFYIYPIAGVRQANPTEQLAWVQTQMQEPMEFLGLLGVETWWALEDWLHAQVDETLGVDLFAHPFMATQGWQIYETARVRLLLVRTESFQHLPAALAEFYQIPIDTAPVAHINRGAARANASLYEQAQTQIKLPPALLEQIYATRFAQHFYTAQERQAFKQWWGCGNISQNETA